MATLTEEEIWATYYKAAQGIKSVAGDQPVIPGIIGRSITKWANRLAEFWGKHKATLAPHLTTLAIAALEALVSNLAAIDNVNLPGPE